MPKLREMAQLSRPFQIALVAVCVLAAVWLLALQGHSSSSSSSQSTAVSAPSTPASSAPATTHSGSSLGSAPGLKGLSHAIAKAHGAVSASERYNRQIEERSARAAGESASTPASTPAGAASTPAKVATRPGTTGSATRASSSASSSATTSSTATRPTVRQQPIKASTGAGRIPARQALVERALGEGKIAVILFWNPKGTDDIGVSGELKRLEAVHHLIRPFANVPQVRRALERSGLELQKRFAAFWATANEVSSFGSITQHVQVNVTPTILIVNKGGQTTELTGLQDAFSIEQAINEARDSQS
jgi:hypothetical protein